MDLLCEQAKCMFHWILTKSTKQLQTISKGCGYVCLRLWIKYVFFTIHILIASINVAATKKSKISFEFLYFFSSYFPVLHNANEMFAYGKNYHFSYCSPKYVVYEHWAFFFVYFLFILLSKPKNICVWVVILLIWKSNKTDREILIQHNRTDINNAMLRKKEKKRNAKPYCLHENIQYIMKQKPVI